MEVARQIEMLLKIELENDGHPKYKLEIDELRGALRSGADRDDRGSNI